MERRSVPPIRALAVLAALAFIAMVTANALANILPLNGVNTGVLSDEIPNLFVPAGLTFAIWGLIYLLLAGHAVAILAEAFGTRAAAAAAPGWEAADGLLLVGNYLSNTAWIFAWHWRLVPLSFLLMLIILGSLIALELRVHARRAPGAALSRDGGRSALSAFLLSTPLRVYLGWISVATIANATALLVKSGWKGFGIDPAAWTVVVILAGLAVALGLILRHRAVAAPLVVVWAYAGIVIKRSGLDGGEPRVVLYAAAAAAVLILLVLALRATGGRGRAART
jgi:hypothetical protein